MENNIISNRNGFTLAEVVISMLLVVLVMIPLLSSVLQNSVFSRRVDMTYEASRIAQRRIELLKGFNFDDLKTAGEETDINLDVDGDGETDYKRTTEITEDYEGLEKLIKVKVTVKKADIDLGGGKGAINIPIEMATVFFKGFEDD